MRFTYTTNTCSHQVSIEPSFSHLVSLSLPPHRTRSHCSIQDWSLLRIDQVPLHPPIPYHHNQHITKSPTTSTMRFTLPILAAIAATITATPLLTTRSHPALRPDVQELITAANLAAPSTDPSAVTTFSDSDSVEVKNCGKYIIKGGWDFDLNANPQCADIEKSEIMHRIYTDKCGLCVTFECVKSMKIWRRGVLVRNRWEQCVGRIAWSGKMANLVDIPDSRSWYCIA